MEMAGLQVSELEQEGAADETGVDGLSMMFLRYLTEFVIHGFCRALDIA